MSHTKEPWAQFESDKRAIVEAANPMLSLLSIDEDGLGIFFEEEDARRVVACVNACAEIDTELLEIVVENNKTLKGVLDNAETKRDGLLVAMKKAAEEIRRCDYTPARSTLLAAISAASS